MLVDDATYGLNARACVVLVFLVPMLIAFVLLTDSIIIRNWGGLGHNSPEVEDKSDWVHGIFEGVYTVIPAICLLLTRAGILILKGRK